MMNHPLRFTLLSSALTVSLASVFAGMQMSSDSTDLMLKSDAMTGNNTVVDLTAISAKLGQPVTKAATAPFRISGNQPFQIPYVDNFDTDINLYGVEDCNHDGKTWKWDSDSEVGGFVHYTQCYDNDADDWLITPYIFFKGGHTYKVTLETGAATAGYRHEFIEAKWGAGRNASAMTNELFGRTELGQRFQTIEAEFTPERSNTYNIGFHAVSNKDNGRLWIISLKIEEVASKTAPAAVTDLKGEPFADGSKKATLTFVAPTKTVEGNELTGLDNIEIRRNNEVVKTVNDIKPGEAYSWIDNNAAEGENVYAVTPFKDGNQGDPSEVRVFTGFDIPTKPVITVSDLGGSVMLSWLPVNGVNGGAVSSNVSYEVYDYLGTGETVYLGDAPQGQLNYVVRGVDTNEGDTQKFKNWLVRAVTPFGDNFDLAWVLMGKPDTIPYTLSFKNATLEGKWLGQAHSAVTGCYWGQTTYDCQDDDNGSMTLTCMTPSTSKFFTGKIALDPNPEVTTKLSFYYKAEAALQGVVYVDVTHRDGTVDEPIFTKDLNDFDNDEWHRVIVDMPASKCLDDYVMIGFHADMTAPIEANLYFDNIAIINEDYDEVKVELEAPESVILGRDIELMAKMVNMSVNDIEPGAKVQLFANDELVGETTLKQPLGMLKATEVPVTIHTHTVNAPEVYNIRAVVSYDKDKNADNNVATATVAVIKAEVDTPQNLEASDSNPVNLTWDAPAYEVATVTDDFEGYDAWSTNLGNWTTVDADQGIAGSLAALFTYPHQHEKFAFMAWRPMDFFHPNQGLEPHSGDIALVSIYQENERRNTVMAADNWLISPLLSGKKQTVSIWVNNKRANYPRYGIETFDILASSTDKNITSFEVVGSYEKSAEGWEEIKFEVPEGTRFFAIHQNSEWTYAYLLMFDDFTYEGSTAPESYNIYRDGELIGSVYEPGFTDNVPDPKATYRYDVTAVYCHGYESAPIFTVKSELIETLEEQNTTFNVFTIGGVQLLKDAPTLQGLQPGIYIINGEKVYLRN